MKHMLLLPLLVSIGALAAPILQSEPAVGKRQSTPLNQFLSLVTKLFPVNIAVDDIDNFLSVSEMALATAAGIDTTEDGLANVSGGGSNCSAMTIIFARGTTEAGNVGALVGPPFFDAVRSKIGSQATVAVQGVDYPADIPGFLAGGDSGGSQTMANLVTSALAACPSTKLVMSGYSQGGQLVHNAAKLLPAATTGQISSVVIFGDPDNGQAVQGVSASKTLVVCHDGDNICQKGDLILLPHLTYAENADTAAAFVVSNAGAISS